MKRKIVYALLALALSSCDISLLVTIQRVQIQADDPLAGSALDYARSRMGAPYVWGGRGPDEFDCSGLITCSYKQAVGRDEIFLAGGEPVTDATIAGLYSENVEMVDRADVGPGDLIFITDGTRTVTHGGLFVRWITADEFEFINASSYHGGVVLDTWEWGETKRGQEIVGMGRLLVVSGR